MKNFDAILRAKKVLKQGVKLSSQSSYNPDEAIPDNSKSTPDATQK
jgi:hypothetical protein